MRGAYYALWFYVAYNRLFGGLRLWLTRPTLSLLCLCAGFAHAAPVTVTDDAGQLVGIVTNRDMRFEVDQNRPVAEIMTKMPLIILTRRVDERM